MYNTGTVPSYNRNYFFMEWKVIDGPGYDDDDPQVCFADNCYAGTDHFPLLFFCLDNQYCDK